MLTTLEKYHFLLSSFLQDLISFSKRSGRSSYRNIEYNTPVETRWKNRKVSKLLIGNS